MISIQVNGQFLEVKPTTKIRIKSASPFFVLGALPGEASYPFDLDATPTNLSVLNNPQEIKNTAALGQEYDAELFKNNALFRRGKLVIKSINKSRIRVFFKSGLSDVRNFLETTPVNELDFGGTFEIPEGRPSITIKANYALGDVLLEQNLEIKYIDTDYASVYVAPPSDAPYKTKTIVNPYDSSNPNSWREALVEMVEDINSQDLPFYAEHVAHPTNMQADTIWLYHTLHNAWGFGSDTFHPEFKYNGYSFGGAFTWTQNLLADDHDPFTRSATWPLCTHAKNQISNANAKYQFPTIYNHQLFKNDVNSNDFLNFYRENRYYAGDDGYDYFSPQYYLKYILEVICESIDYQFIGDLLNDEQFKKELIYNNGIINIDDYKGANRELGDHNPPIVITPNMHMPTATCADFIKNISKRLGYVFVFDSTNKTVEGFKLGDIENLPNVLDISTNASVKYTIKPEAAEDGFLLRLADAKNDAKAKEMYATIEDKKPVQTVDAVADLDDNGERIQSDDFALVLDENRFYKATNTAGTVTWAVDAYLLDEVKSGAEELEIISTFGPMYMDRQDDPANISTDILVPTVQETVTFYSNYAGRSGQANGEQPFDLRVLLWHGLQDDSAGADYPLASTENEDEGGTELTDYTLLLSGENGLYQKNFKDYIDFLNAKKPVEFTAMLPFEKLANLSHAKHLYAFYTRFVIAEIDYKLTHKQHTLVSLKAYKV